MRLDGIGFVLVVMALYMWGMLLALALALGMCRRGAVVLAVTVMSAVLLAMLAATFSAGEPWVRRRPLGGWAMVVVLMLVMVAVMFVAPWLQFVSGRQGRSTRVPVALLAGALALVPIGSLAHVLLQDSMANRVMDRARALAPGQIHQHVETSRQAAARSMLSPYLWSEDAEVQWIVIGLSQLPFIESPERLAEADAQALTHLVSSSAGKESGIYTGKLEGKLVWDRLMHSPASERAAIAARLTQQQAGRFTEYFGVPHADWLCASLADAQTRDALDRLWKLLWEPDGKQFAARILEKCGVAIGSAADPTARRRSLLDEAASRRGAPAATLASPAPAMAPRPVTR